MQLLVQLDCSVDGLVHAVVDSTVKRCKVDGRDDDIASAVEYGTIEGTGDGIDNGTADGSRGCQRSSILAYLRRIQYQNL